MSAVKTMIRMEIQACNEAVRVSDSVGFRILRDNWIAALNEIEKLERFRSGVVGWREIDHPEGFDRGTAEFVADLGREAEGREEESDGWGGTPV